MVEIATIAHTKGLPLMMGWRLWVQNKKSRLHQWNEQELDPVSFLVKDKIIGFCGHVHKHWPTDFLNKLVPRLYIPGTRQRDGKYKGKYSLNIGYKELFESLTKQIAPLALPASLLVDYVSVKIMVQTKIQKYKPPK